jgi:hypothetical protein
MNEPGHEAGFVVFCDAIGPFLKPQSGEILEPRAQP